jgi:hypothetical protein
MVILTNIIGDNSADPRCLSSTRSDISRSRARRGGNLFFLLGNGRYE